MGTHVQLGSCLKYRESRGSERRSEQSLRRFADTHWSYKPEEDTVSTSAFLVESIVLKVAWFPVFPAILMVDWNDTALVDKQKLSLD